LGSLFWCVQKNDPEQKRVVNKPVKLCDKRSTSIKLYVLSGKVVSRRNEVLCGHNCEKRGTALVSQPLTSRYTHNYNTGKQSNRTSCIKVCTTGYITLSYSTFPCKKHMISMSMAQLCPHRRRCAKHGCARYYTWLEQGFIQ
jgi:hypothetical protein